MRRVIAWLLWIVLVAATSEAQTTGGSFGGSAWGSGASRPRPPPPSRPPPSVSRPRPRPSSNSTWGSGYDYDRNRYNTRRRRQDGGAECAATMAVVLTGLVGAVVAGKRGNKR